MLLKLNLLMLRKVGYILHLEYVYFLLGFYYQDVRKPLKAADEGNRVFFRAAACMDKTCCSKYGTVYYVLSCLCRLMY